LIFDKGIAVGLNGIVLRSRDGGKTWTQLETNISEHLWDVHWDEKHSRWVVSGDAGYFGRWKPAPEEITFRRLSGNEFGFHTETGVTDSGYVMTGSNAGTLENDQWELFPEWQRTSGDRQTDGFFKHLSDWKVLPDWIEQSQNPGKTGP